MIEDQVQTILSDKTAPAEAVQAPQKTWTTCCIPTWKGPP